MGDIEHLIQYAQSGYDEPQQHEDGTPSISKVKLAKEDATIYMQKLYSATNEPSETIELFQTDDEQKEEDTIQR